MTDEEFEKQDKSFWEGFNCAKNKMQKRIAELEKENERLKEKCNSLQELVTYYQTNFCQEQSNS